MQPGKKCKEIRVGVVMTMFAYILQLIAKYRGNIQCPNCTGDDTHLL